MKVDPTLQTTKEKMDEFMTMRFGMFIHWGPVTLRGTEIGWSRGDEMATDDYDNLDKPAKEIQVIKTEK